MENIKSIHHYDSAYDLLYDVDPGTFPCLVDDMTTYFEHFDDFEGMQYFLINDETVLITDGGIAGDVIGDPMTVEELYQTIIDMYYESIGEEAE